VHVDVGDLCAAESALVVFDAGVFLAVVLQHLGQAEELDAAICNFKRCYNFVQQNDICIVKNESIIGCHK
jgi:hypothetical protein